jgi:archaellum component FlaC
LRHTEGKRGKATGIDPAQIAQLEERMDLIEEKLGGIEKKIDHGFRDLTNMVKKKTRGMGGGGKFRGMRHSILR